MNSQQHTFRVEVDWNDPSGGTTGPRAYRREHTVSAVLGDRETSRGLQTPPPLRGSAARAFHGDSEQWNPEQLLLASLAQCHTLAFLHVAAGAGVVVTAMTVRGTAELRVHRDGSGEITAAVLRPEVTLEDEDQRAEADALHAHAGSQCFIARSVNFPVTHEPVRPETSGSAAPVQEEVGIAEQRPEFSRRLGAPIATLKPAGRPPSQVSGLPGPGASTDMGRLPPPGGSSTSVAEPTGEQRSFFEEVGGHETFQRIVDVFYAQVAEDAEFRALYPEQDLEPAKRRLLMFLEQYWGGPRTYQAERGHPRLRMRHMPFRIDAAARDTWLRYMRTAVEAAELSPMHEQILWDYLERAAHSMVNS